MTRVLVIPDDAPIYELLDDALKDYILRTTEPQFQWGTPLTAKENVFQPISIIEYRLNVAKNLTKLRLDYLWPDSEMPESIIFRPTHPVSSIGGRKLVQGTRFKGMLAHEMVLELERIKSVRDA